MSLSIASTQSSSLELTQGLEAFGKSSSAESLKKQDENVQGSTRSRILAIFENLRNNRFLPPQNPQIKALLDEVEAVCEKVSQSDLFQSLRQRIRQNPTTVSPIDFLGVCGRLSSYLMEYDKEVERHLWDCFNQCIEAGKKGLFCEEMLLEAQQLIELHAINLVSTFPTWWSFGAAPAKLLEFLMRAGAPTTLLEDVCDFDSLVQLPDDEIMARLRQLGCGFLERRILERLYSPKILLAFIRIGGDVNARICPRYASLGRSSGWGNRDYDDAFSLLSHYARSPDHFNHAKLLIYAGAAGFEEDLVLLHEHREEIMAVMLRAQTQLLKENDEIVPDLSKVMKENSIAELGLIAEYRKGSGEELLRHCLALDEKCRQAVS